jgi:hypothetical protein
VRGEVTLPPGVPEPQTITVTEEMVARGAGGAGGVLDTACVIGARDRTALGRCGVRCVR